MRIAIISDIHSNLEALQTVLAHIKTKNIDKIFCTGDIVGYGANPNECVELLKKNNAICNQGDHDLNAVTLKKLDWFNEFAVQALRFTNKTLTEQNKRFLIGLPKHQKIEEKNKFFLVHGSPKDELYEYVMPTTDNEIIKGYINGYTMLICGHTHLPDLKRFQLQVFLNPGSVGQPRNGIPQAQYAIVDTSNTNFITFEKVNYDIDTASQKIIRAGLPRYLAERLYVGR